MTQQQDLPPLSAAFVQTKPRLNDEQKLQLLAGIQLEPNRPIDRSNLGIYMNCESEYLSSLMDEAGLSWTDCLQASRYPGIGLYVDDAMMQLLAAQGIYSAPDMKTFDACYYVLFIPSNGGVHLKYQRILGSKWLCRFNVEEMAQLRERLVAQLREFGKTQDYADILAHAQEVRESIARRERAQARQASIKAVGASPELQEMAQLTPDGTKLKLPTQQLKHYPAIKRKLETAGAKYDRTVPGFVFEAGVNAEDVLQQLLEGKVVNPKKDFQFFASTQAVKDAIKELLPDDLHGRSAQCC